MAPLYRINRTTYWFTVIGLAALFYAACLLLSWAPQIALAAVLISIPRLHDIGRTGSWSLILFVPGIFAQLAFSPGVDGAFTGARVVEILSFVLLAGALVLLGLVPGQPGANSYGEPSGVGR